MSLWMSGGRLISHNRSVTQGQQTARSGKIVGIIKCLLDICIAKPEQISLFITEVSRGFVYCAEYLNILISNTVRLSIQECKIIRRYNYEYKCCSTYAGDNCRDSG